MSETTKCIVCNQTENEVPIITFKFNNTEYHICSQHIPVLIHKAHELETILPGIKPSDEANQ